MTTEEEKYINHSRRSGKVITPTFQKKDIITDDGEVKVSIADLGVITPETPLPVQTTIIRTTDQENSTLTDLEADETFTGEWLPNLGASTVIIEILTDKDSALRGLEIQNSIDGENVIHAHCFTVSANTPEGIHFVSIMTGSFYRVVYKNGGEATTGFVLVSSSSTDSPAVHYHAADFEFDDNHPVTINRSVIVGKDELTGLYSNVSTFRGAVSISDGLRHKTALNLSFHEEDGVSSTLAVAANIGDTSLQVVSDVGFIDGQDIEIYAGLNTGELFFRVTDVPGGNILTLDQPLTVSLPIGKNVEVVSRDMAVLGSLASPRIFYIGPPTGSVWQITIGIVSMTDSTAMDDGTFGGLPELTNGVLFRQRTDGVFRNFAIWRRNADIASDMFKFDYIPKPPAGTGYGARGIWTYTSMESVFELNGDTNDQLQYLVQDPLVGLDSFGIKAQGRLFSG